MRCVGKFSTPLEKLVSSQKFKVFLYTSVGLQTKRAHAPHLFFKISELVYLSFLQQNFVLDS